MRDSPALLITAVNCIRYCQSIAKDCLDAAYNTGLRNTLSITMRELDEIESGILAHCHSLGIHFDGLPPLADLISQIRLRLVLHFKGSDSVISENMIKALTNARITLIRVRNQTESHDPTTSILMQRLLGSLTASSRNFHSHL